MTRAAPEAGDFAGFLRWHADKHGYALDPSQLSAGAALARLEQALHGAERRRGGLLARFGPRPQGTGIYLWGGVGRGKSFLMDSFFAHAALRCKRRVHFHRFMQEVHRELKRLQGRADPLALVAQRVAKGARLLCLDEFHVSDIGDAMLMRRLLEGLFGAGVALVTTSNQRPDDLYLHGLQRGQFLPAIELLKRRLEVLELDGGVDYRLRALERVEIFHAPLDAQAERNLEAAFAALARGESEAEPALEIEGRVLRARRHAGGVAWFDFGELCGGPRGQADYIELARRYHTVLLAGIPRLSPDHKDLARRLTWLVDEFYDRRVKLICSAAAEAPRLYPEGAGSEFDRTVSRLIEMQSRQYLSQAHLP